VNTRSSKNRAATPTGARQELPAIPAATVWPTSTADPCDGDGDGEVQKITLVTHDYNRRDARGLWDYSEYVGRINRRCDQEGCDTILYAPYTWDVRSAVPKTQEALFEGLGRVRRIILEAGDLSANGDEPGLEDLAIEVWRRGDPLPLTIRQLFAKSQEAAAYAEPFVDDLPRRRIANALVMVCGESNIIPLVRVSGVSDPYRINRRLTEMGVGVVLNPVHDYMRRYEMKLKRQYFSRGGRSVVSVWNQGKRGEAHLPWTVFHGGEDHTAAVRELPTPFEEREDIRIGIVSLPFLK